MTARSTQHSTFVIERTFEQPPARVFQAFADPRAKARWFSGTPGEWTEEIREHDFRVGGRERLRGIWKSGQVSDFKCTYYDIVPNERIVYVYEMHVGEPRISVSLATIEFKPHGKGTQLKITEQGVFLDGYDDSGRREHGTRILTDRIAESLRS
jgi:uncharacterized protein YndB with AHSA1/START domain